MVTIDTPMSIPEKAEASLWEIKEAALEVLGKCVYREPRLGGFTLVGPRNTLQVRVTAYEEEVT